MSFEVNDFGIPINPKVKKDIKNIKSQLGEKANQSSLDTTNANVALKANQSSVDSLQTSVNNIGNASPKGVYSTVPLLTTAKPTGDTGIYLVTGNVSEVASLVISAIPTVAGNVTVTLNGVAVNVAVDPATDTTTALVATKIRNTAFSGWTTGGSGTTITFTCNTTGAKTDSVYSAGTTGATGTMTTTTQGVDNDGNWYYWNGSAWTPGGTYQGSTWQEGVNARVSTEGISYDNLKLRIDELEDEVFLNPRKELNNILYSIANGKGLPTVCGTAVTRTSYTPTSLFYYSSSNHSIKSLLTANQKYLVYIKFKINRSDSGTGNYSYMPVLTGTVNINLLSNMTTGTTGVEQEVKTYWTPSQANLDANTNLYASLSLSVLDSAYNYDIYLENIAFIPVTDEKYTDVAISLFSSVLTEKSILSVQENNYKRLLFWGDSLQGAGGRLSDLTAGATGLTCYHMGCGGENARTIAGRQGGIPWIVQPVTIPADATQVQVTLLSADGNPINPNILVSQNWGVNPCTIAGVEGTLFCDRDNARALQTPDPNIYFTRYVAGTAVEITRPEAVQTYGMRFHRNAIPIIWMGTNAGFSNLDELVSQHKRMLDYAGALGKDYLVLGIYNGQVNQYSETGWQTTDYTNARLAYEQRMEREFGRHFINVRKYIADYGLSDASITPTADDLAITVASEIAFPPSLKADGIHPNTAGKNAIFNEVLRRLKEMQLY